MAIGVITGIIIFALMCVTAIFGGIWCYAGYDTANGGYGREGDTAKGAHLIKKGIALILVAILFLGTFICVPFSWHTVDAGEVAVVKHLGKPSNVRTAGTYYDFWMTNTYQVYDGKVQKIDIETAAYSSDAQTMSIKMNIQYKVLTDKVMEIATQYGSLDALTSRITAIATEKAKSALSAHTAMYIIANRQDMSPSVEESIRNAVGEDYFVNITTVVVTDIEFSEAFEAAVEDKMVAEQQQLKAEYENQTKVAKAEADAKAKIVAAEAEAKANELLEKSLTDRILQEMYIDKWNGKLPEVVTGDDTGIMLSGVGDK